MLHRFWIPFLLVSHVVFAQDAEVFKPSVEKVKIQATEISGHIKIDGKLDDHFWKNASPFSDFREIDPHQGKIPNHRTEARVLYNKHFLYFGIFNKDTLGKKSIRVIDFKRDFNPRTSDFLGLAFDGFNDHRNAMVFTTNPYGVQRDFLAFDDSYIDLDWDGLWKIRTSRTDSGWYAEYAIPWKTLRYSYHNDTTQTWGFNINRMRRMTFENYAMSLYPRSYSVLRMDYAGQLTGLKPPPPSTNIRIQPYVLSSFDFYDNVKNKKPEDYGLKFGGELKWAITPNSVLDLTANTDFAQADADRQVNNVTRFSVFFPERRQFFLENSSLFGVSVAQAGDMSGGSMRIQPFFSRTIGLDATGNPIPIDVGGRFVHRSLKNNFGGMLIKQRDNEKMPSTIFGVARYSRNFGKQNRVGGIFTAKNNLLNTNLIGTIDGFFRLTETHSLNWMLSGSKDTKLNMSGIAGAAQYFFTNNQWKIWSTHTIVTKNYNPEMGFVSRNDVIGTTPGIFWYNRGNWIPFKKLLRSYEPSLLIEIYHQASTLKLTESNVGISPLWFMLQNGGFFGHIFTPFYQNLTTGFSPLGVSIAPGKYSYNRHTFFYSTDGSKKLSFVWNGEYGKYFDGILQTSDFRLNFAPKPHLAVNVRFNRNRFLEVGEYNTSKNVDLWTLESRLALNPRLQLIGFYQRNIDQNANNVNLRLAWEYQPLSYIYLVLNKREFVSDLRPDLRAREDHAIAKISYLKQF
ncbi:MAG: carbohydrate binding family 9 domain-containing protein [Bacteroidetes bacterium]|nr:carbohydrate binding family 9 domain-containing protein [Bacteroidota bacterium]